MNFGCLTIFFKARRGSRFAFLLMDIADFTVQKQ
jgi:hypothetical protein